MFIYIYNMIFKLLQNKIIIKARTLNKYNFDKVGDNLNKINNISA